MKKFISIILILLIASLLCVVCSSCSKNVTVTVAVSDQEDTGETELTGKSGGIEYKIYIPSTDKKIVKSIKKQVAEAVKNDYIVFQVMSGSMDDGTESAIEVTDVLAVNPNDKSIQVGDIITFSEGDYWVTHRVVEIDENGNYITQGDSNNVRDADPVTEENYIGKVVSVIKVRDACK